MEHHWGAFDLDTRFKGAPHAFATRGVDEKGAMELDWRGRIFADLHDATVDVVRQYLDKAIATPECKCVFLLKSRSDTEVWHSHVVKHARNIIYLRGSITSDTGGKLGTPVVLVEFYGSVKGSALVYGWDTSEMDDPAFSRVDYLKRRAASDKLF